MLLVKEITLQLTVCKIIIVLKRHIYIIALDVIKQRAFDADPKEIQQIKFTGNMDREGNITIFLTLEDVKENILHLPQITLRVFYIFFVLL